MSITSKKGTVLVCEHSAAVAFDEDLAANVMGEEAVTVEIDLHDGDQEAYGWGCDLTYDYVKINGSYRS